MTFAALERLAARRARRLELSPGSRVATPLPATLASCELLHALPRRGAVLMPLAQGGAEPSVGPEDAGLALRDTVDLGAVHTLMATSGTTGEPKLVELTYANHLASAAAAADALGVEPDDRWLCPLPLHHVAGLNVLIRGAINRTTVVLHEGFDVDRVQATLEAGDITLVSLVPTMLARLRDAGLTRVPGLRAIALGGGPIPAELLEWADAVGLPVVPVYGLTETCSQVVAGSPGRPLRGVELRIGASEEILIRGPMVSAGALAADGWLHTGDLGRLDERGLLHVEGRQKELIVTGGENVAPLEIEQVLLAHPAVADAGVAGVPDPDWGEAVTAFVVLRTPAAAGELTAWCRERLAPHKVPKAVHAVDALPRTASGKLLRGSLLMSPFCGTP